MPQTDPFDGLTEFLAVARHSSFRAAAAERSVTPAAISQAIRALEARLGLPLFRRTTRRVSLTEAGSMLLSRLRPAATEIGEALDALDALRDKPSGTLRLSVPRMSLARVIGPILPEFRRLYPDIAIEIDVEDAVIDIMEAGFDAGIRIGEQIQRDMIAVRITEDFRWSVLGSPAYFAARGRPRKPEGLADHECLRFRNPGAQDLYRWEFEHEGRAFSIDPPGSVVANDNTFLRGLACEGMGLIYTSHFSAAAEIADGRLETVLEPYLPVTPGLFLYFPARSQNQPKLRVFIDMLRRRLRSSPG